VDEAEEGRAVSLLERDLNLGRAWRDAPLPESFDAGVRDLHRTTEADGVFCYAFFKGIG
jgi:hypothetical protein